MLYAKRNKFYESLRRKGQAETPFILTLMVFVAFLAYLTLSVSSTYPEFQTISAFDFGKMAGSIIGVAAACAIATGLPCAAALTIFGLLNLVTTSNTLLSTLIIIPLLVTTAYVVSRLGKGGG